LIDGVKIIELTTHKDDRGFFREIFRFPEQFSSIPVGQLSHSQVKDGIVKAWHGHVYQSQWNYVVSGKIKVGLYDNRDDSETFQEMMEFTAGEGVELIAYFFPPGILHGYQCTKGPMHIIYVTSGVYDLKDEIRKSSDDLNPAISWK
jgi:dTDP-4-dehydrorhamnose 3,5-epimerase